MAKKPKDQLGAPTRRVLFIDFDGVLHPTLSSDPADADEPVVHTTLFGWLPMLVSALKTHQDVAVVVHSMWRNTHNVDELRELLGALGPRVVGVAPEGLRYASIEAWLAVNPCHSHRILDDDPVEFPDPAPAELILCNPRTGVSAPDVIAALKRWLEE